MRLQKTANKRRTTPLSKTTSNQGSVNMVNLRGNGPVPNRSYGTPSSRPSVDTLPQVSEAGYSDTSFTASMQEFLPFDMSSRATPESTSTVSSRQVPFVTQPMNANNPFNKVDSLMFPSEDPFAYPNQPMMELGFQAKSPEVAMTGQDPGFFLNSSLEDMDSQLLGQPPPYMMHQSQNNTDMGLSPTLFDPGNLLGLQMEQQPQQQQPSAHFQQSQHHQHQPSQQHPQPGPSLSQHRRARQQERQIQQIFTAQGMQPDWGSFFGGGRGGFQGM
jgi:hypothetical protein